ncbi:MAG: UDP-diphosphatase [Candidatus Pelagibacter sp.]|nr:UDP-diphosphatase [Candidatus Pelagibacter sp.]RPG10884.1 MAG: undecaprenyl-diphosphate phosphatase [Pelagibacteraceae bacterium TMED170]|tara:strand:+ start:11594 stop:12352 length:759 start_codon:yes stop_codon:yes gene_type:complete
MIFIFILSIIQGITEFLPISSSSHLILVANYLQYNNQNLSIDISLHIGSFLAVIYYFKEELFKFLENKILFLKIFFSSIPVIIVGFILVKFNLIEQLRSLKIIGWTTIIFGILLYISDKSKTSKNIKSNFDYKSAFFIGLFQVLSLIPGVSRAGISITAGRFLNFKRLDSAKISFLLSIPTLAAVSFFGLINLMKSDNLEFSLLNVFSIIFSFIFSLITIVYFLKFIKKFNLNIFVIYRIILGLLILYFAYL